jgi:hypothetical protein
MSEPVLRVVKGEPSPEELAALVTVISARAAAAASAPTTEPAGAGNWATYWRTARRPLHPGPNRWRASAHP